MRGIKITLALSTLLVSSLTSAQGETYSGWDQNLTGEQPAETAANKDEAEYGKAGKAKGEQAGEAAEPCPTTSPGNHRAKKPER